PSAAARGASAAAGGQHQLFQGSATATAMENLQNKMAIGFNINHTTTTRSVEQLSHFVYHSRVDCLCKLLPKIFEAAGVERHYHTREVIKDFFEANYFQNPSSVFSSTVGGLMFGTKHGSSTSGSKPSSSSGADSGAVGAGEIPNGNHHHDGSSHFNGLVAGGSSASGTNSKSQHAAGGSGQQHPRQKMRKSVTHGNLDTIGATGGHHGNKHKLNKLNQHQTAGASNSSTSNYAPLIQRRGSFDSLVPTASTH
ncbi:unnamed protein product, partial [Amoebophrya sp. A120]